MRAGSDPCLTVHLELLGPKERKGLCEKVKMSATISEMRRAFQLGTHLEFQDLQSAWSP